MKEESDERICFPNEKKNVYIDMLNSICVEVRVHGLLNCMLTTLI